MKMSPVTHLILPQNKTSDGTSFLLANWGTGRQPLGALYLRSLHLFPGSCAVVSAGWVGPHWSLAQTLRSLC